MTSQPGSQHHLHGSAPDTNDTALLLIDVINHFEFPGGDVLLHNASAIAAPLQKLKRRARTAGVPAIYVNDNFGRWQSSFEQLLQHCMDPSMPSRDFVQQVAPEPYDYFVLKPKHSGFFQTPLDILLKHLGTKRLILTGLSTNNCVMFTCHDAYMRDLELYVPGDCVASFTDEDQRYALEHMRTVMKADISDSRAITL